jgi:uncharacterized protein
MPVDEPTKAIDFRFRFRTAECLPEYIPEIKPEFAGWLDLYKMRDRVSAIPVERQVEMLLEAGCEAGVTCSVSHAANKTIYEINKKFPGVMYGFAAANALDGVSKACDALEQAFDEYGLLGLAIGPFSTGLPMDDRRNYPLFAMCERRGKIANIHSSLHFNRTKLMKLGDPFYLDKIAMDFPELKIIMSHAGNGFDSTPIAIAMRHPTIYLEYSGLHPRIVDEKMAHAMNGMFRNRILWGSEYPLFNYDCWQNWEGLLKPEVMPKFIRDNARKLLGSVPE